MLSSVQLSNEYSGYGHICIRTNKICQSYAVPKKVDDARVVYHVMARIFVLTRRRTRESWRTSSIVSREDPSCSWINKDGGDSVNLNGQRRAFTIIRFDIIRTKAYVRDF